MGGGAAPLRRGAALAHREASPVQPESRRAAGSDRCVDDTDSANYLGWNFAILEQGAFKGIPI